MCCTGLVLTKLHLVLTKTQNAYIVFFQRAKYGVAAAGQSHKGFHLLE